MGGGRYWEGVDVLARADWVVSWGLGVAAWRLGCMTSFSCLLLLGRDVPSRWHFTGILEHINNSHFSYLQQVALRFVPSMTVSWRRRKSPTEALGEKGAMESQFKAGNPTDKEGWMSRRGRCPPRIDLGGGEGAEDSVPEKHCMALRIAELGRRCIGIPSSRAGLGVAWPCLSQLPSSH